MRKTFFNGYESQWPLLIIFKKYYSYSKTIYFYKFWYHNFNRTKYSVLQEFDIDLDLTAVFRLKKIQPSVQTFSPIKHILEYKN